jgi:hypothetical protein
MGTICNAHLRQNGGVADSFKIAASASTASR